MHRHPLHHTRRPRAVPARAATKPPRLSSVILVTALATAAIAVAAQIITHIAVG